MTSVPLKPKSKKAPQESATSKKIRSAQSQCDSSRLPGQGNSQEIVTEKNVAPSQWGRRLARLVGEKFGVQMVENQAKNEGTYQRKDICIKCAKSPMPPVSVLVDMLERVDQLWAVYVMFDGTAQVWSIDTKMVRELGYFTHGEKVQKRVEIYLRRITPVGTLIGSLTKEEVESCRIP